MYSHKSAGLKWRKSSRSSGQGTNCVEVAFIPSAWRKSSRSTAHGTNCVEVAFVPSAWRKSSHSKPQHSNCVEVARVLEAVAVRDSKDPDGPMLTFSARAFSAFLASTKHGQVGD